MRDGVRVGLGRLQLLRQGVEKFNAKPRKGVDFLQLHNFVTKDHADVARFLAATLGLNKASIGEYLGGDDAYELKVMHAFVDQLNFTGLAFVDALRLFLQVRPRCRKRERP